MKTRYITHAAVIAALYAALTVLAAAIPSVGTFMFGPFQVRIAEALTILPFFTPAAIPGLAIGCFISNLVGAAFGLGGGILDIIFGTLATLAAAWCTSRIRQSWFAPLPPVLFNAFIVAAVLSFTLKMPYWPWVLSVGMGQLIACYGLGYPLLLVLKKHPGMFKKQ